MEFNAENWASDVIDANFKPTASHDFDAVLQSYSKVITHDTFN